MGSSLFSAAANGDDISASPKTLIFAPAPSFANTGEEIIEDATIAAPTILETEAGFSTVICIRPIVAEPRGLKAPADAMKKEVMANLNIVSELDTKVIC
mmetsp:Transcript_2544/g.3809  ORF Transcript_2544/g.3809 Transcript_2544/m.3809 type:complete len:99 (+) Transcript_2544:207-503(+)